MATLEETRQTAADFLRFYLQGGAAAARAGTQLIDASRAELAAALARFDADPTPGAATSIEKNPVDAFVRTPGIARRIPAVVGPAPDFLPCPNGDLTSQSFTGASGRPLVPEAADRPVKDSDFFVDMCALEEAVVRRADDGGLEVTFLWVQDYPGEETDQGLDEAQLPRIRPVVDAAQPSVVVAECMEALEAFLGRDEFMAHKLRGRLQLCAFEALEATRDALEAG